MISRPIAATFAGAALTILVAGCGSGTGFPTSSSGLPTSTSRDISVPSTWGSGQPTFPHRRNSGNDGTSYEPCLGLSDEAALSIGVDPKAMKDAALVDGQTARGCDWRYTDQVGWTVSQIVGNAPDLDHYKITQKDSKWREDVTVNGRHVGISEFTADTCSTHVQSERAIVTTIVQYASPKSPPIDEICDRAIAFTKATIGGMPR
ncbi:DUF3558 family protein [Gordonia sp. CPCC 205333]|uniref:DUF3558 family protein n=1 Tax=Gordonia sp. CPCC 205333 TaxID=3140790 RepID=UPI003AF37493